MVEDTSSKGPVELEDLWTCEYMLIGGDPLVSGMAWGQTALEDLGRPVNVLSLSVPELE